MNKAERKTLAAFQCERIRAAEESFAQTLAEQSGTRLFFVNENQAFTDGLNIIVDPAMRELYADTEALRRAEEYLRMNAGIHADRWIALQMITRAQTIHEALHQLYSSFPPECLSDPRAATRPGKLALSLISNIIEDAFIEAAGCSAYDDLERYLVWMRVLMCFSNVPAEGTVRMAFQNGNEPGGARSPLVEYLEHICLILLYPMAEAPPPAEDIAPYVEATRALYAEGSVCGEPDERYAYSRRIYDIIEPLIPFEEPQEERLSRLEAMLCGMKTHSAGASSILTGQLLYVVSRELR